MILTLSLVEKDTVAEAVVSDRPATAGKKGGEKEVQVRFSVDGKRKRAVKTEGGVASFELKDLKPGRHIIRAEVVGDGACDEGEVVIKPKTVGFWGALFIVLYWIVFGFWFGYPAFTLVALVTTLAVFAIFAGIETHGRGAAEIGRSVLIRLGDNNWVLRTTVWMVLGVVFLWWVDPTAAPATLNPIEIAKAQFWAVATTPLEDPLGEFGFWATINSFLFGEKAMGWGVLGWQMIALVGAIVCSRWDEVLGGIRKWKIGGIGELAAKHSLGEVVTQPLEWIVKGMFGGGGKK